jgi:hypothetical protein
VREPPCSENKPRDETMENGNIFCPWSDERYEQPSTENWMQSKDVGMSRVLHLEGIWHVSACTLWGSLRSLRKSGT